MDNTSKFIEEINGEINRLGEETVDINGDEYNKAYATFGDISRIIGYDEQSDTLKLEFLSKGYATEEAWMDRIMVLDSPEYVKEKSKCQKTVINPVTGLAETIFRVSDVVAANTVARMLEANGLPVCMIEAYHYQD